MLPANWRTIELANGRSPASGRAWGGLKPTSGRALPTEGEWAAFADYQAYRRDGASHDDAMLLAYGTDPADTAVADDLLVAGILLCPVQPR